MYYYYKQQPHIVLIKDDYNNILLRQLCPTKKFAMKVLKDWQDDHLKTNPEQNYKWNIEPEGEEI